jgi:hypothetical protein
VPEKEAISITTDGIQSLPATAQYAFKNNHLLAFAGLLFSLIEKVTDFFQHLVCVTAMLAHLINK